MRNKCECQKGVSSRLRGQRRETAVGKCSAELRTRGHRDYIVADYHVLLCFNILLQLSYVCLMKQEQSAASQFEQELTGVVMKDGQPTTYSQSVSVDVGQPITLCCRVVARDAEVTWTRNRVLLNDSRCL